MFGKSGHPLCRLVNEKTLSAINLAVNLQLQNMGYL